MKFMKLSLVIASLFLAVGAMAQGNPFDIFGATRITTLAKCQPLNDGAATPVTNTWVDIRNLTGMGTVIITVATNTGAVGSLQFGIESSVDQTNTTAIQYGIGTNYTQIYTNNTLNGGNATNSIFATNTYTFPGVIVYPTSSSAGWATPYLVPTALTNTGVLGVSNGVGTYVIGFKLDDAQRYVHTWWTANGASTTNAGVSATLISRGIQVP